MVPTSTPNAVPPCRCEGGSAWTGEIVGEPIERLVHTGTAVTDVAEQLGLGEYSVGKGERVFVERRRWRPWLELAREVVVEREQCVVAEEPRR